MKYDKFPDKTYKDLWDDRLLAQDVVNRPSHYEVIEGVEAKDIIKAALDSIDLTSWEAYCLGNILKYRLRAGEKDELEQDIAKAKKYKEFSYED